MSTTSTTIARAGDLAALLHERYSCRGFRSDAVPRATIEQILALAQRTPSWCNSQPWQITIVSGAAIERLRATLPDHVRAVSPKPDLEWPGEYRGIYNERRRECGLQLYAATGVKRGDHAAADRQRLENFRFFGAPHVGIVTTEGPLGVYGAIDCGAYVNTFTLAARALGIASIAQAALAAYPDFWRQQLGLPVDRPVVCGISFGFEDPDHPANAFRTNRAAVSAAATWLD